MALSRSASMTILDRLNPAFYQTRRTTTIPLKGEGFRTAMRLVDRWERLAHYPHATFDDVDACWLPKRMDMR